MGLYTLWRAFRTRPRFWYSRSLYKTCIEKYRWGSIRWNTWREDDPLCFYITTSFFSENHPKQKRVDAIIVELHEESDHSDIINTWRSTEAYIKKKKEKRGTLPSIGLSHAADKTEVFDESTTSSSGSQREGNSPRFSSTDEGTKKINNINEALEATSNPQSARSTMSIGARWRLSTGGNARLGRTQSEQIAKFSEQKVLNHRKITSRLREVFLYRVE